MPKWTCKDGRELELFEMTLQHVVNALAMCERNLDTCRMQQNDYPEDYDEFSPFREWVFFNALCQRERMLVGLVKMLRQELERRGET